LPGFFRSISLQDHTDYILYLIDNSESPESDRVIRDCTERYPLTALRHVRSGGNIGVAAGNNLGIDAALTDGCTHVLLLNNDIEFDQPDAFRSLLKADAAGEALSVPKILYHDSRRIWMAGGRMDHRRALGVHEGYGKPDGPEWNKPHRISYAPTCFMLVRREVFDRIGRMDERYFAYYDDTDFVFRALDAGFTLYYEPRVVVLHKVSSSAGENSPFYVYYSNRNKLYFIRKHYRGFRKIVAIAYLLVSRIGFWLGFDRNRRKKLREGIRDGFRMPIQRS
jgi:GT2 family glycosyltransferase